MERGRRERLIEALRADSAEGRAAALSDLRMLDLGEPEVLRGALRACDDDRPAPAGHGSGAASDPFAAFFGGAPATQTLGELAVERLVEAGLPGHAGVAQALAGAITEADAGERRIGAAARLLAETPWEDRAEALRLALPGLLDADASLFAVVATADDASLDLLRSAALQPFRPRLVNEMLNCDPARPGMLEALADAAVAGLADPSAALQAVALLFQWRSERAAEAAAALEAAYPWAVAFTAVEDAAARLRLADWLQTDADAPPDLPRLISLVLEHAEPMPDYPLAPLLERIDGGCGPIAALGAASACADLLRGWVTAGLAPGRSGRGVDRAWAAVRLLLDGGLLDEAPHEVAAVVVGAVARGEAPLDVGLLEDLAAARLPGLHDALCTLGEREPAAWSAVVPALLAAEADPRPFLERALRRAEAAPIERVPRRRGLVETRRAGVDVPALQPLVERLDDAALLARLDELLPVVGPE